MRWPPHELCANRTDAIFAHRHREKDGKMGGQSERMKESKYTVGNWPRRIADETIFEGNARLAREQINFHR